MKGKRKQPAGRGHIPLHASGDVCFDRSIPLYGVDSDINVGVLAYAVLRNEEKVELARPRIHEKTKKKTVEAALDLDIDDLRLFESLRELRKQLARDGAVPPYVIFGDATLVEISRKRPRDEMELLAVNGVGQVKLESYGKAFLRVISSDLPFCGKNRRRILYPFRSSRSKPGHDEIGTGSFFQYS
jgi:superfamily II DNA helicase RecQ